MKIVTRHYDNGKADVQMLPDSFKGVSGETELYDQYVEDIGDVSGDVLVSAAREWIINNLTCESYPKGLGGLNIPDMSRRLAGSISGFAVDISGYI